jgi:hypothetical protein
MFFGLLNFHSLETSASIRTFATGLGALLAMIHFMLCTFFTTFSADFLAFFYYVPRMRGMRCNKTGSDMANFCTIPVQSDTLYHLFNVLFVKTGICTHFTCCRTLGQFLKKFFVVSHD